MDFTKKPILILTISLMIISLGVFAFSQKRLDNTSIKPTFTGKIESVDTSCFFDAVCSVTIDGKKVILVVGRTINPPEVSGLLKGVESIGDLEGKIGEKASVYAKKTTEGDYTIYGDANYYVEVLE